MEKLELKHLAPYLPYGLEFVHDEEIFMLFGLEFPHDQNPMWIKGITPPKDGCSDQTINVFPQGCKPLLRPLSDLEEMFPPSTYWHPKTIASNCLNDFYKVSYNDFQKLIERRLRLRVSLNNVAL